MTKSLFYLFGCGMPDLLEALVAQMVESPCSAGNPGSIPVLGRSTGEGNGNPLTPVLLPGKFHRWRSLAGYSPWGRKELDMTEQLHFHFARSLVGACEIKFSDQGSNSGPNIRSAES